MAVRIIHYYTNPRQVFYGFDSEEHAHTVADQLVRTRPGYTVTVERVEYAGSTPDEFRVTLIGPEKVGCRMAVKVEG